MKRSMLAITLLFCLLTAVIVVWNVTVLNVSAENQQPQPASFMPRDLYSTPSSEQDSFPGPFVPMPNTDQTVVFRQGYSAYDGSNDTEP